MVNEVDAKKGIENYLKFWSHMLYESKLQFVFNVFSRWFFRYVDYHRRLSLDDLLNRLLSFILAQFDFSRAELFFVFARSFPFLKCLFQLFGWFLLFTLAAFRKELVLPVALLEFLKSWKSTSFDVCIDDTNGWQVLIHLISDLLHFLVTILKNSHHFIYLILTHLLWHSQTKSFRFTRILWCPWYHLLSDKPIYAESIRPYIYCLASTLTLQWLQKLRSKIIRNGK